MSAPTDQWRQKFAKTTPEDDTVSTLVLVQGKDAEGAAQWAYALIPADNYLGFRQAETEGGYRLSDFGKVLHYGTGETPPEAIQQEMQSTYGANPDFEKELESLWNEAIENALEFPTE